MSLDRQITELTSAVQSSRDGIDEGTRFKAIKAAQGLLAALGSPAETVIQDVVMVSFQKRAVHFRCCPLTCMKRIRSF